MKFSEFLKMRTKKEWGTLLGVLLFFSLVYILSGIPFFMIDPFFYGVASIFFIHDVFFRTPSFNIKTRIINAFFGGAFIHMFVQSSCALFAKWAVWRFI